MIMALCAMLCEGAFAQAGVKTVGLNVSYGTEIENIGVGVKGQYYITDAICTEASFDYFLKKDGLSMWDVNFNAHYLFPIGDKMKIYPLAGLSYTNWKYSLDEREVLVDDDDTSDSVGKFGVNLGGGFQYDLTESMIFNAEVKYQLINTFDQVVFSVGLAYKF